MSRVGPKPSRISARSEVVGVVDWALTWTPLDCRRAASCWLFQKDGTWVANRLVGLAFVFDAG
jgi:hypothetical protein